MHAAAKPTFGTAGVVDIGGGALSDTDLKEARKKAEKWRWIFALCIGAASIVMFGLVLWWLLGSVDKPDLQWPRLLVGASFAVTLLFLVGRAERLLMPLFLVERLDLDMERARPRKGKADPDDPDDRVITLATKIIALLKPSSGDPPQH